MLNGFSKKHPLSERISSNSPWERCKTEVVRHQTSEMCQEKKEQIGLAKSHLLIYNYGQKSKMKMMMIIQAFGLIILAIPPLGLTLLLKQPLR